MVEPRTFPYPYTDLSDASEAELAKAFANAKPLDWFCYRRSEQQGNTRCFAFNLGHAEEGKTALFHLFQFKTSPSHYLYMAQRSTRP